MKNMTEVFTIRAILDADEDVIRDVAIHGNANLFDLHHLLVEAFGLEKGEMSSFFKSNDDWEQGEEISMLDMNPDTNKNPLEERVIEESFIKEGEKMLFVYDFLNLWTFYLEALSIKIIDGDSYESRVLAKVGELPETAPEKEMKAEDQQDDLFSDWGIEEDDTDDYHGDDWY